MHFDDRLATVLRHRATGERAARTQFRQLLDLLGSRPATLAATRDQALLGAAWLRLGALGEMIPAADRAAMIRDPGLRFRNPELAVHLAEDEPEVAAAALARADLSDEDWEALIPHLPIRARGFLRLRRDMPTGAVRLLEWLGIHDRGLPLPDANPADQSAQPANPMPKPSPSIRVVAANDVVPPALGQPEPEDSEITALVKRIEAFRQARSDGSSLPRPASADAPRLPLGDPAMDGPMQQLDRFAFTCDAEGRINWAEPEIAPMVVGMRIAQDEVIAPRNFARHQPVRNLAATLEGAPLICGDWIVDAAPRFTDPGGRFFGYAGMFRRPAGGLLTAAEPADSEADRIRQLLHELRTPVNAIQGFAEIIQQQLFGPAPHEYRALAATIAGDSARILAGFDELDRLARLETGALELDEGACDLRTMAERTSTQLHSVLQARNAGFALDLGSTPCRIAMAQGDCEALGWRLLATFANALGAGETVAITLDQDGAMARLGCHLPAALEQAEDIFSANAKPAGGALSAGMFGAGFALRLARAEAQAAGGALERKEGWLTLTLPLLTEMDHDPSEEDSPGPAAAPTAF